MLQTTPRSTSVAIIHQPAVLDIPFLQEFRTKAKLSYLSAVTLSADPLIAEISSLALRDPSEKSQCFSPEARTTFTIVKRSVTSITRKTLPKAVRILHKENVIDHWDSHLQNLSVQDKFLEISQLEKDNRVWNRIQRGLPAGQLSFLLRAGSDTLPTPLNLRRWKLRTEAHCDLCSSTSPITLHILNACPVALNQGRYTWHHDSVLQKIVDHIKTNLDSDENLYADLSNHRGSENPPATIPPEILVTSARPDIVIIKSNSVVLMELTIPYNSPESLANAHARKSTKRNYQIALSNLERKGHNTSLVTIEIGALDHSLTTTHQSLQNLLPTLSRRATRAMFDDAAKITIGASHTIFLARKSQVWPDCRNLLS